MINNLQPPFNLCSPPLHPSARTSPCCQEHSDSPISLCNTQLCVDLPESASPIHPSPMHERLTPPRGVLPARHCPERATVFSVPGSSCRFCCHSTHPFTVTLVCAHTAHLVLESISLRFQFFFRYGFRSRLLVCCAILRAEPWRPSGGVGAAPACTHINYLQSSVSSTRQPGRCQHRVQQLLQLLLPSPPSGSRLLLRAAQRH